MEEDYETNEEVDYSDETFETTYEEEEPVEPMSFADEFSTFAKKPVDLVVPNLPSAFNDLGAMDRKNLGYP